MSQYEEVQSAVSDAMEDLEALNHDLENSFSLDREDAEALLMAIRAHIERAIDMLPSDDDLIDEEE